MPSEATKYICSDEIRSLGILQEANRQFFHPLGLAAEIDLETGSIRLQDARDDPEGWIFGDGVMERKKYERFLLFSEGRFALRRSVLGYVIQGPPK